jgi:hypothetical protein
MKKLLTICLIMAAVFTVNAQNGKPTKEQTIAFIQRQFESLIGTKNFSNVITKYEFEPTKIYFEDRSNLKYNSSYTYTQINWGNLVEIKRYENDIQLFFKSSINRDYKAVMDNGRIVNSEKKIENYIQIPVPDEKFESMKKAFLRLSEIAKEENKDPFQD